MKICVDLPDDLVQRLTSEGLLSDEAVARLLSSALDSPTPKGVPRGSAYEKLFEQTHDAVFMVGLDGRQLAANQRAVELTGYPLEELLTLTFRELSAEIDESQGVLHRLIRGIKTPPYERVLRTKDGREFTAEVSAELVRDERGTPLYIQSVVRDITLRKHAEKVLQESARMLRQIIDLVPQHIFAKDREGRYIIANQAVAEAYGTTIEELEGKTDADFAVAQAEVNIFLEQDRFVMESGSTLLIPEEDFTDSEGRQRVLRTVKMPLIFPDREEPAVLGVSTDITERKQAEKTLQESARMLRQIIDLVPQLIFVKDRKGRYIIANQSVADAYGTTIAEIEGKKDTDFSTVPGQAETFIAQDKFVAETGITLTVPEEDFIDFEGYKHILRTVKMPLVFPDHDEPAVLGVSTDITERKQTEKILQDNERVLRQIIDLVPHYIYAKDRAGRYILANKTMADLYGTTTREMIGKTDYDFVNMPDDAERYIAQDRHVIDSGERLYLPEEEFSDGKGGKRIFSTVKIPLMFPNREEVAVLGASTDITHIKQASNELRQAYRQALELAAERQRVQILTQFIQDSSHEFRTPLSVISTSLYLMTRTEKPERIQNHAQQAAREIERITHLLDQLQTMADLDSGIDFEFTQVNTNLLLGEIVNGMSSIAQDRRLSIRFELSPTLPPIRADMFRLKQAFGHVLENAIQFTPQNGLVVITTAAHRETVSVEIRDNGIGIPPEMIERAKQRFWRRDEAHSTPGFGLGLPIVQKIIERHLGTLTIDSLAENGTTVTITLPITHPEGQHDAPNHATLA